jgi:Pentapeptide repeats (8 copies)
MRGVDLYGADLSEAKLHGAILRQVNLCDANLSRANLRKVDFEDATLINADLRGAELNGATLVRTNLEKANLTGCSIYGISVWNVQLIDTNQLNLIITDEGEPTITVDNLEIAQFIYLLLEHKKIREVLNSVMERGVLLLGRFGNGGLELLQSVAEKLRDEKYLPMIFDFDRPDSRNYTETVKTLVGLSRFVIVDLSGPSVPQEPYSTIPHFKIPFVPIIEKRRRIYSMFPDLLEYPWVLKPVVEFENKEHSRDLLLPSVIKPAEEKFKERQALLQQLFHG